jgi:ribosomal protein L11 methylase PrmA
MQFNYLEKFKVLDLIESELNQKQGCFFICNILQHRGIIPNNNVQNIRKVFPELATSIVAAIKAFNKNLNISPLCLAIAESNNKQPRLKLINKVRIKLKLKVLDIIERELNTRTYNLFICNILADKQVIESNSLGYVREVFPELYYLLEAARIKRGTARTAFSGIDKEHRLQVVASVREELKLKLKSCK